MPFSLSPRTAAATTTTVTVNVVLPCTAAADLILRYIPLHTVTSVTGADRILVIKGGKVKESGTHAQLLEAKGEYNKLVTKQMQVHTATPPDTPTPARHCFPVARSREPGADRRRLIGTDWFSQAPTGRD